MKHGYWHVYLGVEVWHGEECLDDVSEGRRGCWGVQIPRTFLQRGAKHWPKLTIHIHETCA